MKNTKKRLLALGLAGAMLVSAAGCSTTTDSATTTSESTTVATDTTTATSTTTSTDSVTSITLYPKDANLTSGTVSGWLGEYFATFGFEVEVWAYSDEKTTAILASGDLPDIMYVPVEYLDDMIEAGMLLNLEEYLDQMPHVQSYEYLERALNYVREYRSNGTGELYCLPLSVGPSTSTEILLDSTERNAVKINWEVYEEIGAPEINDFYDLIDVMEAMMEARSVDEDGNSYYGTVLNTGDASSWYCMTLWYRWQGYVTDELAYLLEMDMVNGTVSSILSKDSLYYQGLKWYNEAYRRGVMDEDSISNDRATQKVKVDQGYTMIPSGNLPGWASTYLQYLVPGETIYYNSSSPYGDATTVIAINANTENVEACLAFLDMLANPDAYMVIRSGSEGGMWEVDEDGNAVFTDAYWEYKEANDGSDFILPSGDSYYLWNTTFIVSNGCATSYGDGEGGYRTPLYTSWSEYQEYTSASDIFAAWQETTGYSSFNEWLEAEDALVTSSVYDYVSTFESTPDSSMQLIIDAIDDVVITASWQMVYAATDEEFDDIWEKMVSDCEGLGCQEIIEWRLSDIENAVAIRDSLE